MRPLLAALLLAALVAGCTSEPPAAERELPARPTSGLTTGDGTGAGTGGGDGGSGTAPEAPDAPDVFASPLYGVAVSPPSYEGDEFARFFDQAADVGSLVLWGGDVEELDDVEGPPTVVSQLAAQRGLHFGAQVGFSQGAASFGQTDSARLLQNIVDFTERTKPAILVLGVEVNREDAAFVDAFAAWYDGAYDAVKRASPATKVFPSFQLETMKGMTGGLFGGAELSPQQWDMLDRFPKRDLVAFTTYPSLVYHSPNAIPDDYYTGVAKRVGEPIGFTEVGYHAGAIEGWESTPEEQAQFVARFFEDASAADARLALWLHLHDQPQVTPEPFQTMGLVGSDGVKRASYDAWVLGITG